MQWVTIKKRINHRKIQLSPFLVGHRLTFPSCFYIIIESVGWWGGARWMKHVPWGIERWNVLSKCGWVVGPWPFVKSKQMGCHPQEESYSHLFAVTESLNLLVMWTVCVCLLKVLLGKRVATFWWKQSKAWSKSLELVFKNPLWSNDKLWRQTCSTVTFSLFLDLINTI